MTSDEVAPSSWANALHLTNGDTTIAGLKGTGLAELIVPWRDVLHEGPVPLLSDPDLRELRASFLAGEHAQDIGTVTEFAERDHDVETHRTLDYVLWFEADPYDQLQLIQILAKLRHLRVPAARVTLICIGEHLGIAHFGGLGQLSSNQLRNVASHAAGVLDEKALEYAELAWAAFRAPEPTQLATIANTPSDQLRFVAEAFDRVGREYPSTRDGLSLTERRILAAVAHGAETAGSLFEYVAAHEMRPFLGDTWCFDRIERLMSATHPLLKATSETGEANRAAPIGHVTGLTLTDNGHRVLEEELDHVELNGVDRWIGGVHLRGQRAAWRWHEGVESVISTDTPQRWPQPLL